MNVRPARSSGGYGFDGMQGLDGWNGGSNDWDCNGEEGEDFTGGGDGLLPGTEGEPGGRGADGGEGGDFSMSDHCYGVGGNGGTGGDYHPHPALISNAWPKSSAR